VDLLMNIYVTFILLRAPVTVNGNV